MILRGFIMGRIGNDAVILIGGSMLPWADPSGSLAVGDLVQLELVEGTAYSTSFARTGRRDTSRLLLLEGPSRIVLAVPRTGPLAARVNLVLTEVPAEVAEGLDPTFNVPDDIPQAASGSSDRPVSIPPALRGLFQTPQSGPVPQ